MVGGDTCGLTDDGDSAGALTCRAGVSKRETWVVFDQPTSHHEVTGDGVRVVLVETQQIAAHGRIELRRFHLVRDVRLVGTRVTTLRTDCLATACRPEATFPTTTTWTATGSTIVAASLEGAPVIGPALAAVVASVVATPVSTALFATLASTAIVGPVVTAIVAIAPLT